MSDYNDIEITSIDQVFKERYAVYGTATVKDRAIPSVYDGLTPVLRRIVYTYYKEGDITKLRKAALFVGKCLGYYHPVGDASVYESMVGISQEFNKLNPLIDKQGNVGSADNFKSYAAQRYVEMKLSPFASNVLLHDMSDNYVPMKDNYDGSLKEPKNLPARLPMIFNTGIMGIASGFASEIPTHKIDDICELTIRFINSLDKPISDRDLIKDFRPDFPMGSTIVNEAAIPDMYIAGKGAVIIEATIDEEKHGKRDVLVIKDLPYRVSTSKILNEIKNLCMVNPKTKQPGILADKIADFSDLSSKTQAVELVIFPKKDVSLSVLKNILYEQTSLRTTVKYLPNVLIGDDLHENASITTILKGWLDYRINILGRKFNYEIKKSSEQQLLKKALIKAHKNIDKVIELIKKSISKETTTLALMKLLDITRRESEYIISIQLYQINKLEVNKLEDEIEALQKHINYYVNLISKRDAMLNYIIAELESIGKKYTTKRKSALQNTHTQSDFDVRAVLEEEDLIIGITTDNYVYAKAADDVKEYVTRGAKGANFLDKKYKRIIRDLYVVNSHDDLFVFTDTGKVFELKGYELNIWNKPMSNVINGLAGQNVVSVIKANPELDKDKYFTFVTKNSLMKHVKVNEMVVQRKIATGNIAVAIDESDKLIGVNLLSDIEHDRIVITSNLGRAQNLCAADISVQKRPSSGVPKATLRGDEYIKCITIIPKEQLEGALILVAASNGIGKMVALSDLPKRKGSSGKRSLMKFITLKGNSELICGLVVQESDQLIATTKLNKTNKIAVNLVSTSGRNAMGVKLTTLSDDDTLIDLNVISAD